MDDLKLLELRSNWKALTTTASQKLKNNPNVCNLFGGVNDLQYLYSNDHQAMLQGSILPFLVQPNSSSHENKRSTSSHLKPTIEAWGVNSILSKSTKPSSAKNKENVPRSRDKFSKAGDVDTKSPMKIIRPFSAVPLRPLTEESVRNRGNNNNIVQKHETAIDGSFEMSRTRRRIASYSMTSVFQNNLNKETRLLTKNKNESQQESSLARLKLLQSKENVISKMPLTYLYSKPELRAYAVEKACVLLLKPAAVKIKMEHRFSLSRAFNIWKSPDKYETLTPVNDRRVKLIVMAKVLLDILLAVVRKKFDIWAFNCSDRFKEKRVQVTMQTCYYYNFDVVLILEINSFEQSHYYFNNLLLAQYELITNRNHPCY